MIKGWCGKPCSECANPCALDESMPCSPDCEHLAEDGSYTAGCQTCENMNVRTWYMETYPDDSLGSKLNDAYFYELDDQLGDVYKLLGEADSIVRERCFEKLAEIKGCNYDEIYFRWLGVR